MVVPSNGHLGHNQPVTHEESLIASAAEHERLPELREAPLQRGTGVMSKREEIGFR